MNEGGHHHDPIESRAAIAGHPVHPMLIPFPIAFLVGALFVDLAWFATGSAFWPQAALWLLGAGLVLGLVAGLVGAIDFAKVTQIRSHRTAWIHAGGNIFVLVLAAVNLGVRVGDASREPGVTGLVLSVVTVLLLGGTAWLGGELVYRHRIGVKS